MEYISPDSENLSFPSALPIKARGAAPRDNLKNAVAGVFPWM
jgi:hypothetical protein